MAPYLDHMVKYICDNAFWSVEYHQLSLGILEIAYKFGEGRVSTIQLVFIFA
jgi:hypothetical protein